MGGDNIIIEEIYSIDVTTGILLGVGTVNEFCRLPKEQEGYDDNVDSGQTKRKLLTLEFLLN